MASDESVVDIPPLPRMLTPADVFSLGNALLGLLAILAAAAPGGHVRTAFTLILLAVLFDGMDGHLSRRGHGAGRLGATLDSLADLISFVAAPAVLVWFTLGQDVVAATGPSFTLRLGVALLAFAVLGLYFLAGLLRLARFDYLKGGEQHDFFLGMPTPAAAVTVASLALVGWEPWIALALTATLAYLMGSRIRLPKARGPLGASGAVILLTALALGNEFNNLGPTLLLAFSFVYLAIGPSLVRRRLEEDAVWTT